jgi:hypothetical protein
MEILRGSDPQHSYQILKPNIMGSSKQIIIKALLLDAITFKTG